MPQAIDDRAGYAAQLDAAQTLIEALRRDNAELEAAIEQRAARIDWRQTDVRAFYALTAGLTASVAFAPAWVTAPIACALALYLAHMVVETLDRAWR